MGESLSPSPTRVGVRTVTRYFMLPPPAARARRAANPDAPDRDAGKPSGATSTARPRKRGGAISDRAFFDHADLFLLRRAGGAVGPAAAGDGGVVAARPVDCVGLVRASRGTAATRRRSGVLRSGKSAVAVGELRLAGPAPAAGAFAAETGIGQQAEGGFHSRLPVPAVISTDSPPAGVRGEFEAGGAVRFGGAGEAVDGGGGAHRDFERRRRSGGQQAFARRHRRPSGCVDCYAPRATSSGTSFAP